MTTTVNTDHIDHHHEVQNRVVFGLWIYILSDCIMFAVLFACYAVLKDNTFGGVSIRQVASLPYVLAETLFLLFSSFTYGLCFYFLTRHQKRLMMFWLSITFILGLCFVLMEFHEFSYLVHTGNSWQRSAFLSSFFSLVGIHGIHVLLGLIWMFVLMMQFSSKGLTPTMRTRFVCLGLFWHFLDIMWIFIFTLVYLMGAI